MPRRAASPSSDSDDAPEASTFSQSKNAAKIRQADVQRFHAAEKMRRKERNRGRDRRAKERAAQRGGNEGGGAAEEEEARGARAAVEARMQRAMEDAAGESDAEGEDHLMSEDDPELDASSEGSLSRDFAMSHDNLDEDADTEDDAEEALPLGSSNPNYLPDDLFTTAFASSSQPEAPSSKRHLPTKARKPKRKPARNKAKDTIIGPRAIRVLPKLTHQASQTASYTVPSQNVTKFLTRSLNLKGQKPKKQAWQRLPANIGVMKRSGPAATFVRR